MNQPDKVLYTAKDHHGWPGRRRVTQSDGRLDINFSVPGKPGTGTNPEQRLLFCRIAKI